MRKVFKVNLYFLIILLLQLLLPIDILFKVLRIEDPRLMLLISHIVIFIVPALIYLFFNKKPVKEVLKLNKLYLKDAAFIVLLGLSCQPIMMFLSLISQFFFENEIGVFLSEINSTPYLILLLLIAGLPAISEEITIRGIILDGYENKNTYIACIMTGLLFGIMHLNPQQFLYATVLGFVLALLVRITNTIFAASLLHFIVNGFSVTMQKVITLFGDMSVETEQAEANLKSLALNEKIIITIFYGVIALAFLIIVVLIIKKLIQINRRRGVLIEGARNIEKERVINAPFLAIVVIYIFVMVRIYIL